MKATLLLKHNVDALLRERHHKRKDLAQWCRRTEAWLSKLMTDESRNVPMKYFDRIADFFGIATYQLFQPGISPLTERRSGRDRRAGRDRRVSNRAHGAPVHTPDVETVTPWERSILARLRTIKEPADRRHVEWTIDRVAGAHNTEPAITTPTDPLRSDAPQSARVQRTQKQRGA